MCKTLSLLKHRSPLPAVCFSLIAAAYSVTGDAAEPPDCKREPQECANIISDSNRLINSLEVEKSDLVAALSSIDVAPLSCGSVPGSLTLPPPASVPTQYETYKVTSRHDNLWKIAEQRLGDGNRYPEIVALNNKMLDYGAVFIRFPDTIFDGQVIFIPKTSKIVSSPLPSSPRPQTFGSGQAFRIVGSGTVFPLNVRAAECFRDAGFDGLINVTRPGSLGGVKALCELKTTLAAISLNPASINPATIEGCPSDMKFEWIPIAEDGIVFAINPSNPLLRLHKTINVENYGVLEDLLYRSETWGDLAKALNLKISPDDAKQPIIRYFPTLMSVISRCRRVKTWLASKR